MPVALKLSSATVVNLSLLTADFYSLFCGLFLFHYKVSYVIQWNKAVLISQYYNSHNGPLPGTFKGLGHSILGNFSIDQMVIQLTMTIEELKQNTGKPRRGTDGQNWRGLRLIAFG